MKTNDQVKHLFAHHQAGDSNNLHSDGATLKSYSTPIAQWIDGVCFISSNGMTPTTASKHLSGLMGALRGSKSFYTPAPSAGDWTFPSAATCIIEAAEEMQGSFKTLCRSRVNLEDRAERYNTRRAEILSMAARFQVQDLPAMPEAGDDLKQRAKEMAAQERERKAREQQRREEQERAQRIIDQGQLDLWLQQGRGSFPRSFRVRGEDRITIKDPATVTVDHRSIITKSPTAKVVTSQGAEAPLAHVIVALRFYDSRKHTVDYSTCESKSNQAKGVQAEFTPYHTNGHKIHLGAFTLDEIDEQGNVRAGCHTFTAQEIARFRKQWGL